VRVNDKNYRTVWLEGKDVYFINQNLLPFEFRIEKTNSYITCCDAIFNMQVRGAGAIGALAGFAMALAFQKFSYSGEPDSLVRAKKEIESTRPTARNLYYAVERVYEAGKNSPEDALTEAQAIADRDASDSLKIGEFGSALIENGHTIETHCNAGWLAFVDYGTALSPVYLAHQKGKKVFVYVDETRPRSQGARLTAWELQNAGVPHSIIPDNAGAWLMSKGKIDVVITGADRIAVNGDTANKIGTLEKAVAAYHFGIPFYVAAPLSTFDKSCATGNDIVIEERSQEEVHYQSGPDENGVIHRIRVTSPGSTAINPAFDVTPADLITGFITEKGIIKPGINTIVQLLNTTL
jgi:S-methyl-5-thioribose-1-phosphate isomerase